MTAVAASVRTAAERVTGNRTPVLVFTYRPRISQGVKENSSTSAATYAAEIRPLTNLGTSAHRCAEKC